MTACIHTLATESVPDLVDLVAGHVESQIAGQHEGDDARSGRGQRRPGVAEPLEDAGAGEDEPGRHEVERGDQAQEMRGDLDHRRVLREACHQPFRPPSAHTAISTSMSATLIFAAAPKVSRTRPYCFAP